MAKGYVTVDHEQAFLLPPDVRDWVPEGHLARYVVDAVKVLDTSEFHAGRRLGGTGRAGYDPDMLLGLLIYCYARKERSSRRIEQLCEVDVACRFICGNNRPDHTVIARFRADNEEAFKALFAKVVALAAKQGAVRVGTLAIDGTKIEANASRLCNRTRAKINEEIDRIVAEAVNVDAAEDAQFGLARGDELPEALANPKGRVERLRRCLAELDAEEAAAVADSGTIERVENARAHLEQTRAEQQAKVDAYEAARAAGRRPRRRPVPADEHCLTKRAKQRLAAAEQAHADAVQRARRTGSGHQRRRNTTDPDSGVLRSQGRWVQGYNAQAAFSADGFAVASDVTRSASDVAMLHPLIGQAQRLLTDAGSDEPIAAVVADAGYWSNDNVTTSDRAADDEADEPVAEEPAVERPVGRDPDADEPPPPRLFIPPKDFNPKDDTESDAHGQPPPEASPAEKMRHRLRTPEGKKTYAKRAFLAEGPFGHIKAGMAFTRFSRRGQAAAESEWAFMLAVRNLTLLHRRGIAPATG